jgi:CheY-like chemotaxis protein
VTESRTLNVLLVEDDPGDILITEEALRAGQVASILHVVNDGEQAIGFLTRDRRYADAPRPDLILLDLNLPKIDGHGVLTKVKADPNLRRIPVIVLSTSQADDDVLRSYDLHANAYVSKPVDFQSFVDVVREIDDFFARTVALPPS